MTDFTFLLVILIAFAGISSAQPYLTRPELFFAVTVAAGFRKTEMARRIVWQYQLIGWLGTIVVIVLLFAGAVPPSSSVGFALLGWGLAFLIARARVQPHRSNPSSVREATLSPRRDRVPGGLAVMAGPFVILAAKAVYAHLHWDEIPERFPVHWGFGGPDRWADRTALAVYGYIGSIALICAVLVLISYGTVHASRRLIASPRDESEQKFRTVSVLGLIVLAYVFAIVLPPIAGGTANIPFAGFLILGTVAVFLAFMIWLGQGGTRLREYQPVINDSAPIGDRTPDQCWKLGIIYYNPDDPALVVEKRFGIGWTLNFGNRWCWILVSALILLPVVLRRLTG